MCKTYNINSELLLSLLNDAELYCLSNDINMTESNLKRYAQQAARLKAAELKRARITSEPIDVRRKRLRDEITPLVSTYGRKRCNEFYAYWTEADGDGIMRFELERTWNTASRLKRFGT